MKRPRTGVACCRVHSVMRDHENPNEGVSYHWFPMRHCHVVMSVSSMSHASSSSHPPRKRARVVPEWWPKKAAASKDRVGGTVSRVVLAHTQLLCMVWNWCGHDTEVERVCKTWRRVHDAWIRQTKLLRLGTLALPDCSPLSARQWRLLQRVCVDAPVRCIQLLGLYWDEDKRPVLDLIGANRPPKLEQLHVVHCGFPPVIRDYSLLGPRDIPLIGSMARLSARLPSMRTFDMTGSHVERDRVMYRPNDWVCVWSAGGLPFTQEHLISCGGCSVFNTVGVRQFNWCSHCLKRRCQDCLPSHDCPVHFRQQLTWACNECKAVSMPCSFHQQHGGRRSVPPVHREAQRHVPCFSCDESYHSARCAVHNAGLSDICVHCRHDLSMVEFKCKRCKRMVCTRHDGRVCHVRCVDCKDVLCNACRDDNDKLKGVDGTRGQYDPSWRCFVCSREQ